MPESSKVFRSPDPCVSLDEVRSLNNLLLDGDSINTLYIVILPLDCSACSWIAPSNFKFTATNNRISRTVILIVIYNYFAVQLSMGALYSEAYLNTGDGKRWERGRAGCQIHG